MWILTHQLLLLLLGFELLVLFVVLLPESPFFELREVRKVRTGEPVTCPLPSDVDCVKVEVADGEEGWNTAVDGATLWGINKLPVKGCVDVTVVDITVVVKDGDDNDDGAVAGL